MYKSIESMHSIGKMAVLSLFLCLSPPYGSGFVYLPTLEIYLVFMLNLLKFLFFFSLVSIEKWRTPMPKARSKQPKVRKNRSNRKSRQMVVRLFCFPFFGCYEPSKVKWSTRAGCHTHTNHHK